MGRRMSGSFGIAKGLEQTRRAVLPPVAFRRRRKHRLAQFIKAVRPEEDAGHASSIGTAEFGNRLHYRSRVNYRSQVTFSERVAQVGNHTLGTAQIEVLAGTLGDALGPACQTDFRRLPAPR